MLTDKNSKILYAAKAVAVLLIVWAHMSTGGGHSLVEQVRISVCQIGVIVFFVTSGFFYKREAGDSCGFWCKKFKTVILPWLLFATFTFCISLVLSGSFSGIAIRYIKWVLGIGTPYWYMSVMMLCFALFKLLPYKKTAVLYACMVISLISLLLSIFSVIDYNLEWNQYTNILNWIGVFALGILIRQKNWLEKLLSWKLAIAVLPVLILCVVYNVIDGTQTEAYIGILSLPIELLGGICVLSLAMLCYKSRLLIDVGKKSFFIYLVHIQVAGIVNVRLPDHPVFLIIKPFVAVAVCYVVAKVLESLLKKLKIYEKIGNFVALR